MQPKTKDVLLWSILLTSLASAALQQPRYNAYPSQASDGHLSVADGHYNVQDSLKTPLSDERQRDPFDRHVHNKARSRTRTSPNERALATFAPADAAVRAFPPAPPSSVAASSTAGLTSRQPARSLQDWQVEDIILLATVDGKLHGRDRTTGTKRWALQINDDRPMVETIHHRHNKSLDENGLEQEDPLWIVEPSQDGNIYIYAPNSGLGMQKLGFTVKELADMAPYASEGPPAVAYTAEKKNYLYTIDAATGEILKEFSSSASMVNESSCRRVNPLDKLDEEECEPIGTLVIGRTEWTISIQDRVSYEPITTLRFFEWVPNNRDHDLRSKYSVTMDGKYIYPRHDGSIYGIDLSQSDPRSVLADKAASFQQKFDSPVARVFDVVRPFDDHSREASLVALPQPMGPNFNDLNSLDEDAVERVWVDYISGGSWYALSESNYPAIARGAPLAEFYNDDFFYNMRDLPMSQVYRQKFSGIHELFVPRNRRSATPRIEAPEYPGIDAPPPEMVQDVTQNDGDLILPRTSWNNYLPSVQVLVTFMAIALVMYAKRTNVFAKANPVLANQVTQTVPPTITVPTPIALLEGDIPQTPKVREKEPATETIFPYSRVENSPENDIDEDVTLERVETMDFDAGEDGGDDAEKDPPPKPKAHKRGKRGGRKQKEKEQAAAEARTKRTAGQVAETAEVITVAASESTQVSGSLQINSLVINIDKVIGQGSCGTCVFEGTFEGRAVAVKRMLSQYYELASQEVSFLQQSDDHPNVVRYFCQQKDDHFLYIAVELCQASLFEVWEGERARDIQRQGQLIQLKRSIQQDTPHALQQLAAGLYHLHNLRIIHRDIKPQNILVAYPKRGQNAGPRLVISDFGLGKNLPENVSTLIDPTGNAGTSGWKAPELISQPKETDSKHSHSTSNPNASDSANGASGLSGVKRAADIFSLGCLFFWVLTDGCHPFEDENGWQQLRELNIKRDHKKMGTLERWSDAYEPMQLITWMLEHQPQDRPTALQVLNHPFFWTPEKRLAFLCDCSDHFEREPRGVFEDGYSGDSLHLRKDHLLAMIRCYVDMLTFPFP